MIEILDVARVKLKHGLFTRIIYIDDGIKKYSYRKWSKIKTNDFNVQALKKLIEMKQEMNLATVHLLDYGQKGKPLDVEIEYAKKGLSKKELRAKIFNGCWDYFGGINLASKMALDNTIIGFSRTNEEVLTAVIRGNQSKELERLIDKAKTIISEKQTDLITKSKAKKILKGD